MEFNSFILVCVYVPNSGDNLKRLDYRVNNWDLDFHKYLKELEESRKKPVIVAGDLNVAHNELDIYDAKGKDKFAGFTPQERQSFNELLNSGFVDTYRQLYPHKRQYTYWSAR